MKKMKIGIDKIGVYVPRLCLDQKELAIARGWPAEKIAKGLGLERMAVPQFYEDSISMAANAAKEIFANGVCPEQIGKLVVATETGVDSAKPVSAYLLGKLDLPENIEHYEVKNACVSGAYALFDAINWIRSGQNEGKSALVVCSDIARYQKGSPAEPTQGAGAVALLVSKNPHLVAFDLPTGTYSKNVADFCRPCASEFPVFDGKYSCECYTDALMKSYADFKRKTGRALDFFDYFVFHTPYPRLAEKALVQLFEQNCDFLGLVEILSKLKPSLQASKVVGNIYTGSVFLALASLLETKPKPGAKIGFFSYGSGCSAKFFAGRIENASYQGLEQVLSKRTKISVKDYDSIVYGKKKIRFS